MMEAGRRHRASFTSLPRSVSPAIPPPPGDTHDDEQEEKGGPDNVEGGLISTPAPCPPRAGGLPPAAASSWFPVAWRNRSRRRTVAGVKAPDSRTSSALSDASEALLECTAGLSGARAVAHQSRDDRRATCAIARESVHQGSSREDPSAVGP